MGMAASQARYLALTARQSNLEYQGQQINQERTTLSESSSALYTSLLNMEVPTPPSTKDYTKIEYSGTDGTTDFTIGSIVPTGDDTYTVELAYSKTGDSLSAEYNKGVVSTEPETITGNVVQKTSKETTGNYKPTGEKCATEGDTYMKQYTAGQVAPSGGKTCYSLNDGIYEKVTIAEGQSLDGLFYTAVWDGEGDAPDKVEEETKDVAYIQNYSGYYVIEGDGCRPATASDFTATENGYKLLDSNTYILKTLDGSGNEYKNNAAGKTTINGSVARLLGDLATDPNYQESYQSYVNAIQNVFGEDDKTIDPNAYYVYFTTNSSGVEVAHFAKASDIAKTETNCVGTYIYTTGNYTKKEQAKNCTFTFDTSGRITRISIPVYNDAGELTTYREIETTATEVKDEDAYNDAYAQYEYDKYVYEQKQNDIDAEREIIQEQDKKLELQLTELDNERTAIKTELDAIKEVVKNNVEKSFKTFSG